MTTTEMATLAHDCFAAFNAAPPKARACEIWAEQCRSIPAEANVLLWIREKLINRDNLPRQFGREVMSLFIDWRSQQGITDKHREACPNCDAEMPGFFFAWKREEGQVYKVTFRCSCNQDKMWRHYQCIHKREAERQGYTVMPEGYKLGSGNFEARLLGYKRGNLDKQKLWETLHKARSEQVRPEHKRQLEENELW